MDYFGLAIDLGWSYFVKKSAQNAADSASLAAAYQALNILNGETVNPFPSPGAANGDCDLGGNLQAGCQYAEQNDFTPGGHGGRQKINIKDGLGSVTRQDGTVIPSCPIPGTAGCVEYWVTVRTVETIPQLFSAVLGNTTGLSSARATAAVVQARVNGSLITMNRAADNLGPNPAGIDVTPSPITVSNGMFTAGAIASGSVIGPIMALRSVPNPGTGTTFQNMVDGPQFLDPLRGYGQPPLPTSTRLCTASNRDMTGDAGGILLFQLEYRLSNSICYQTPLWEDRRPHSSGNYVPGTSRTRCTMAVPAWRI